MGWISHLFRGAKQFDPPTNSTSYHDLDDQPVPIKPTAVDLRSARELVSLHAMKTAHAYGIPAGWLTFEVVTISDTSQAYFQLQVVMNIWDDYLAAHAYAFERAVIKRIRADNVEVGRAVRAVLWRVAPEAGCPYDDMPEAQAWSPPAIKKRAMVSERINRELYAINTPASGAAVPNAMPLSAEQADRADRATSPNKYDNLLDDEYADTRPSVFNGFAATQPYIADIAKKPK